MTTDRSTKTLIATIAVILGVAALRATSAVTLPLAFAVFLVVLLWPLERALERRVPKGVALAGSLLALFAVLAVFTAALVLCADTLADGADQYRAQIDRARRTLESWAERAGISLSSSGDGQGRRLRSAASRIAATTGGLVLVLAFAMLALAEVERWNRKLGQAFGRRAKSALALTEDIAAKFRRYVLTRTLTSAATGAMTGLFTWAIGLDFPLVWGVSSFLLNYIPTLGSVIAVLPPALLALVQFGPLMAAVVLGGLALMQLLMGNYVDPYFQGRNLELSPLVVLFSIAFWGFVWGIPGALLGVPLTVAIAIVCRHFPQTRWIGELLADDADDVEPP